MVDSSEEPIILTLWNSEAENFNCKKGEVLLINNALVKEFVNKKSLTHDATTTIIVNPAIPEREILKNLFENKGEKNIYSKIINLALI